MLDRVGEEVARATTIVKFAPDSHFPAHQHGGGEEFFVLEGVFSDESGDYPKGSYVRNPIGSSHRPFTRQGCTILVKLYQFAIQDQRQCAIATETLRHTPKSEGVFETVLHDFGSEQVALARWLPGTQIPFHQHHGGEEIFVLQGSFYDEHGAYPQGTWLRQPHESTHKPLSEDGCLLLIKTGHLMPD